MFIRDSRRSYRTYSYAGLILITDLFSVGTPVGVTELILMQDLYLYRSTCKYYKTYTGTSYLILVLRSISWSYGTYTGLSEHILVFRILYVCYKTYTCLTELILVLRNLYWYYETYIGLTELILILRILSLCKGTHRYNKSELIIIVSYTGSDQTYTDTYQVWTLVHSRYRSEQIHILILRIREYP